MSLNTLYSQMAVSDLFMYTNLLTLNKGVHQMHFIMFFFSSSKEGSAVSWRLKTLIYCLFYQEFVFVFYVIPDIPLTLVHLEYIFCNEVLLVCGPEVVPGILKPNLLDIEIHS